jgi:LAS superfamily LD-carboxypeptidase LdcB
VNAAELTGRARTHLGDLPELQRSLNAQAIVPFVGLRREARAAGIDLYPWSAFRDFDRQLAIWNAKYAGERPVDGADGRPLDVTQLTPDARIAAILRWSALPGASRHHWGTDLDLVDRGAIPAGYRVRLVPEEFVGGGPFAPLSAWLDEHAPRFGFFRPFRGIRSGVQAEPWHFSFAPLAEPARRALSPALLRETIAAAALAGKEAVLAQLEELHARYVDSIDWP